MSFMDRPFGSEKSKKHKKKISPKDPRANKKTVRAES